MSNQHFVLVKGGGIHDCTENVRSVIDAMCDISPPHTCCVSLPGLVLLTVAAAIKPALWVLSFAVDTKRRQMLMGYWVALLALVVPLIHWVSAAHAMPTILVRKGYHLLALGLFLPALLWEPQLLALSLAIALALLVVLEVVRLGDVPYIGETLHLPCTDAV